jgi:hypothetical protein
VRSLDCRTHPLWKKPELLKVSYRKPVSCVFVEIGWKRRNDVGSLVDAVIALFSGVLPTRASRSCFSRRPGSGRFLFGGVMERTAIVPASSERTLAGLSEREGDMETRRGLLHVWFLLHHLRDLLCSLSDQRGSAHSAKSRADVRALGTGEHLEQYTLGRGGR